MLARPRMEEPGMSEGGEERMLWTVGWKSSSVLRGSRQAPPWMKLCGSNVSR
jgi:hypothetical protein